MSTEHSSRRMLVMLIVGMGTLLCLQAHAEFESMMGCSLPIDGGEIEIEIIAPTEGTTLYLPADPSGPTGPGPEVEHRVRITARDRDITDRVSRVDWEIIQEWKATEPLEFAQEMEGVGNPGDIVYPGWGAYPLSTNPSEHQGCIRIWATVRYQGIEKSVDVQTEVGLAGVNPAADQVLAELPTDRLKAIAWLETEELLTQFDAEGAPEVDSNGPDSYDWGIMRLNDASWADTMEWNYVAWNWRYNVQKGKWLFAWLPCKFTSAQDNWSEQEKLDLRTYGYNRGWWDMRNAEKEDVYTWPYVTNVINYEATKPWE